MLLVPCFSDGQMASALAIGDGRSGAGWLSTPGRVGVVSPRREEDSSQPSSPDSGASAGAYLYHPARIFACRLAEHARKAGGKSWEPSYGLLHGKSPFAYPVGSIQADQAEKEVSLRQNMIVLKILHVLLDEAPSIILGALIISTSLRGIDKIVERIGERHPGSSFWPWCDKMLDTADLLFGWIGDLFKAIVFTRKGL